MTFPEFMVTMLSKKKKGSVDVKEVRLVDDGLISTISDLAEQCSVAALEIRNCELSLMKIISFSAYFTVGLPILYGC